MRGDLAPQRGDARDRGGRRAAAGRGRSRGHVDGARSADGRVSRRTAPARAGCPARCGPRAAPRPSPATCSRIGSERGVVERAPVVVDQLAAERLRHALGRELHLVEHARRIGDARHVEQEHRRRGSTVSAQRCPTVNGSAR